MRSSSLAYFHPRIRQWFGDRLGAPTEVQEQSWTAIRKGEHVLLTAPTGSGKTLAAFLWAINQLVGGIWPGGTVRVLYVSPMKALNNDVRRNLVRPLLEIERCFREAGEKFPAVHVLTRSGDTPEVDRRRMYRKPPEILITTPESLNILVTSQSGRALFSGLCAVILDEIHAVLPEKRGTHLITAVDRLVPLSGEFQRIALSATVQPLTPVADFVGGSILDADGHYEKRRVTIIRSAARKEMSLGVTLPPQAQEELADGNWWPAMIRSFKEIIRAHDSTLFFANSRRLAEKVTRLINENEPEDLAYSHHGSLSREIRLAVETRLKAGELKAIVATNSLELGIDIGRLDRVVLVEPPQSIAATIQRIGRSGHGVGEKSEGLLFPLHGKDFVQGAVLARAVLEHDIEEVHPIENPLDILAQIILAMVVAETWDIDALFAAIRTSYPYRHLSRKQFDLVLAMLAGRYGDSRIRELRGRIRIDTLDNTVKAKDGVSFLLYTGGGTIPDRGVYVMRHQETRARLGELDEEFVWERRLGETFSLGAQVWRIQKITHNDVEVVPVSRSQNIIPFWKGEPLIRSFHLSAKIGEFLESCNDQLREPEIVTRFMQDFCLDQPAAEYLRDYLARQREATGTALPHRHNLVLEHFHDPLNSSDAQQVILHTLWGSRINTPFSLALAAAWQEKYHYPLQVFVDNDCILLMLPHAFSGGDLFSLVNSDNLERLLRVKLEESGYFGARFRENAGRALLLPKTSIRKRMPLWLNRLRSKKLLEAVLPYADFPILLETWRECFQDDFDLPNLKLLLDELESGAIAVTETTTHVPSPFADSVLWRQTNKLMYEDDTPEGGKHSLLSDALIRELVFTSHLRPRIEREVIAVLIGKLHRTQEGYAPLSGTDLIDWIEERLLIPESEWQELLAATIRDSGLEENDLLQAIENRVVWVQLPQATSRFICAVARLPFVVRSFGLDRDKPVVTPLTKSAEPWHLLERSYALYAKKNEDDEAAGFTIFLANWLACYGPLPLAAVKTLFGVGEAMVEEAVAELEESEQVVLDTLTAGGSDTEICSSENLEILLRLMRRARQPAFTPLECDKLPLFLAAQQGVIAETGADIESLQHSLDTLFGYPAPCSAWEEYIFPARVKPFRQIHLDSLLQSSGLVWYGCGPEKTSFSFAEDLELFLGKRSETEETLRQLDRFFPDPKGRYSFFDMQESSRLDGDTLSKSLWSLVWQGYVTNDSYAVLRAAIEHHFKPLQVGRDTKLHSRRSGFSRWKASRPLAGPFSLLLVPDAASQRDLIDDQELRKDRVRQLFLRYGIVFRELLAKEQPDLQWRNVYKTLRLMELSGEILSGYFFKDIAGAQFLSLEAYRTLRRQLDEDAVFWLNAADPASLCGLGPEALRQDLPRRVASTFLVYHGSTLSVVLKKNGRELEIRVPPGHPRLGDYLHICRELLSREFRPLKIFVVEKINGVSASRSEYLQDLTRFGFSCSHKGLELRKNL